MDDATGMTWAMIVGEDSVSMKRLGALNTSVPVAMFTGKTPAQAWETVPSEITNIADTPIANGANFANANYSGIPGTIHCLGADCKVGTADDGANEGKLIGSWYFQPAEDKAYYEKVGTATVYTEEMNYARFGHWLVVAENGEVTVNTYAWSNGNTTDVQVGENVDLDDTATYSGSAAGMSLHKTFDSQGEQQSIYSGRFTADVSLTADFDTTSVSGMIDNFQGNATDPTWSVELERMTLATSPGTAGTTSTGGTGADGQWNHEAYGVENERPTGIFGNFTAHWTDGHAAGAYATRKDE